MKYYFIKLDEQNGDYEYSHTFVTKLNPRQDPDKWVDNYMKDFYCGECTVEDDMYMFHAGQVAVYLNRITEITEEEYNILCRYL